MLRSGFFNSVYVNGEYDRTYNADDYSANMGAIIRSGVLRDANNGLRVTASGLVLAVTPGRAWLEGRWAWLDTVYTFPAIAPPVGDFPRVDSISLQLDTSINARQISFVYKTGTPAIGPTAPPVVRDGDIFEICLAHIWVNPNATTVTVTDCRPDMDLCGWVTSPIGYEDYFANLDAVFDEWLQEKRETLAVNTLFKQYMWRTVLEASSNAVTFDIPQHNGAGVDIIQVYVNGLLEVEGVDYTLSGSVITFGTGGGGTGTKTAGTEIVVICYKSIDGTGLGSVSDAVTALQNQVSSLVNMSEYNYICTGLDDNVKLSQIAQTFLAGGNDGKTMTVRVYGNLGVTAAYGGAGTALSPYRWFAFGTEAHTSRRICFDFENCSQIGFTCPAGTQNIIFYGYNVCVKNAKILVESNTEGSTCIGFNSTAGTVLCENCVIQIYGYSGCYLGATGTFRDCSAAVFNSNGVGRCFIPTTDSFLRVFGGDYRAYAATGRGSAVFIVAAGMMDAVVIANAVNCSRAARTGYTQEYSVYDLSANAKCAYTNIVSPLSLSATGQAVSGSINANKTVGAW